MPQLITIQHTLESIVDPFDPPQNRIPGWHVTDLKKAADAIAKGQEVPNGGWEFDGDTTGLMAWGRMWEAAIRPWVTDYSSRMGFQATFSNVIEADGIIGNLDGLLYTSSGEALSILEMKATTTADTNPLLKPNWMCQCKAYCHMVGVNQVWFLVLHMPRRGAPEARVYQHMITFEDWEIAENWQMLKGTKEYLESKGIKLW